MISTAVAFFISGHGYGHAARSCAVMEAMYNRNADVMFHIFTDANRDFFEESLPFPFQYYPVQTDVGMVQNSPFEADMEATLAALDSFLPLDDRARELASEMHQLQCKAVVSDISPLGLQAAKKAHLPSFLLENFTWEWIYEEYTEQWPQFHPYITSLRNIYEDEHFTRLRAIPNAQPGREGIPIEPISRGTRSSPEDIKTQLGLAGEKRPIVLITVGGIQEKHHFLDHLEEKQDFFFLIPGQSEKITQSNNILSLPHHSDFHHPDLVNAAELVVGKLGYSTLSEAHNMKKPFLFVKRSRFKETPVMEQFVMNNMAARGITDAEFRNGSWLQSLKPFYREAGQTIDKKRITKNGKHKAAEIILDSLN